VTFLTPFFLASALMTTPVVQASVRSFQIHSFRQLTSKVDRLFGRDGNAFANIFCSENAAEILFVDSRVPDLDGKNFVFDSIPACHTARSTIHTSYRRCVTALVLNTQSSAAQVITSKCH
jgi:hypothetical protein